MTKENKNKNTTAKTTKGRQSTHKQNKKENPYFEAIHDSLLDVVDSLEKGRKLTCREVAMPEPPKEMKPQEIVDLRENQLHLSQHLFAILMNVSTKTVQAWEQNINTPSGAALRLLWLAQQRPDVFTSIFSSKA
ncbi:MAG: hypothetical protein JW860_06110 [Sedimentisphaerales bacterium]|nr:hypothetical protein [Sedimentisphaerales bacterium]